MNESGSRRRAVLVGTAAALGLCACGVQTRPGRGPPPEAAAYLSPPTVTAAARQAGDAVRLSGRAPPDALVRLRSPDGGDLTAPAGSDGRWSLTLPPSSVPRLYALQAELPNRIVRGEGALAVLPAPGDPALTLRAGFAGVPAGQGRPGRLQLETVDYDGDGAAVGGLAPPLSRVRLTVDGDLAGVTNADAQGRFAVLAVVRNVAPGPHRLRVETPQGLDLEQPVELTEPQLDPGQPFAAAEVPGGWRITWSLPGGGVQSSLVFDRAAVSSPPPPGRAAAR